LVVLNRGTIPQFDPPTNRLLLFDTETGNQICEFLLPAGTGDFSDLNVAGKSCCQSGKSGLEIAFDVFAEDAPYNLFTQCRHRTINEMIFGRRLACWFLIQENNLLYGVVANRFNILERHDRMQRLLNQTQKFSE
jgi:hypothetical protein